MLAQGGVTVDSELRPKSYRVQEGEEVVFELPERDDQLRAVEMELRLPYADDYLFVVDKPAGVVVHPGAGHASDTLASGLLAAGAAGGDAERPGIVHRLDRDTSGLMVVARSDEAHRRLQGLVRRRALEREYAALVRGRPRSRKGRI